MSKQLFYLRSQINKSDATLLKTLARRFALTKKIGAYKARHHLPPQDKKREKEIFLRLQKKAEKLNLDKQLIKKIYRLIMKIVREEHKDFKK